MGIHDRDYMRDESSPHGGAAIGPGGAPMIVWIFIAISVTIYALSGPLGLVNERIIQVGGQTVREVTRAGSLSLSQLQNGEIWRLVTHQFVHGSIFHLLVNMLMLFYLGKEVALRLGSLGFALVYLIGGVAAGLFEMAFGLLVGSPHSIVGASGSVSALLGIFAMLLPNQVVSVLLFFVIPVRGRMMKLAWGWVILNVVLGLALLAFGSAGVAWMAHAGGTLYGFLHGKFFLNPGNPRQKTRRRPSKTVPYSPRGENPNIIDAKFTDKRPDYNDVLDKINREGISSLTPQEREILERASQTIKQRKDS